MKYVLTFWAIVAGALLVFGGLVAPAIPGRMSLRALNEPRLLTVVVNMRDADRRYRWLSVHGCSADVGESGAFCTGDFERESSLEITGQKQALIAWRDLPGGTMLIHAMAFDGDRQVLARATTVVFRGR